VQNAFKIVKNAPKLCKMHSKVCKKLVKGVNFSYFLDRIYSMEAVLGAG